MDIEKVKTSNLHNRQIKALKMGIEALRRERRRYFAAGERAYNLGIRKDVIKSERVTGVCFSFAEDDHLSYLEYSQAIQQFEDLIEILNDPGVIRE